MNNFWRVFVKVIKAYSLEEKVISIMLLAVFSFMLVKGSLALWNPSAVLADSGSYTEAEISQKPVLINPLYVDFAQANRDISGLVFSGLLKYDAKLKNFVDDLASLKISEDKKEYILVMKDNLKWHDGKPLTVDDVIFTFNIINSADFQNPLLKANFEGVKISKVDEKTVKFVLNRPNSFFISNLNVGILPKHILEGVSVTDLMSNNFNLSPIGSGPYKVSKALESFDDGKQKVVLEKNADFYADKTKINQIKFNVYPDEDTLLKEKAAIDIVSRATSGLLSLLKEDRFKVVNYSLPQYSAVFFNTESKILKNAKIRIGLVKSIDKDGLIAKLDNKVRVDTPLMNLNQKDWIYKPDQNEANGALFDAGYQFKKDDKGQVVAGEVYRKSKDGVVLELNLVARAYDENSAQDVEVKDTVKFLVEAWAKVGVKVNVTYGSESEFLEAIKSKTYDMILTGQNMGYNLDTFPFWHSSQVKEGGLNLSNFRSFAVDAQIEKIRETFDLTEKANRQKQLAEILAKEVPALFLYRPNYVLLTDEKVQNIYVNDLAFPSDRFSGIASWCVKNECK